MRVVGGALVALIAVAAVAGAQGAVSPFTKGRVVLADHRAVEGRVVSGDSSVLVVDTGGGRTRIARGDITSISAQSTRTGRYALRGGMAGAGVLGALVTIAVSTLCVGEQGCAGNSDAVAGGVIGFTVGAIGGSLAGATLGAFVHDWTPVAPGVQVKGLPTGALATESCSSIGPIQGSMGRTNRSVTTEGLSITIACVPKFAVRAE